MTPCQTIQSAFNPILRLSSAFMLLLATTITTAQPIKPGLTINNPWMRFILPSQPAAGYFTLSNPTDKPRTLVSVSSPDCGMLMMHKTSHHNGIEEMNMVDSVNIPAHGSIRFEPGSYHLMCMSPSKAMIPGHSVPVILRFKDGPNITAAFVVRNAAGQ